MKKNDIFELEITDINNLGFGVGRSGGLAVFTAKAVVGDVILAKAIKVKSDYAVAVIEKMLKPSDKRISNACTYSSCGGCAYSLIDYASEKDIKRNYVKHALSKCGVKAEVAPVASTNETEGYRNKAQYPVSYENGKYKIGFYAPRSHRVVECEGCKLQPRVFSNIVAELKALFEKHSVSVYNEESKKGLLRHIYLRYGKNSGEIILVLVVTSNGDKSLIEIAREISEKFPQVVGVMLNINREDTNVICSDEYVQLLGKQYIRDELCGLKLEITPASFYQVNHDATELLYGKAAELAEFTGGETLLDLYCGIGSIGLSMASRVNKLIGVEIVDSAVECARKNASLNGIANAEFFAGDAADVSKMLDRVRLKHQNLKIDVTVLDPPRKGCSEELLKYIASELKTEKIVYISCNPDTLARDLSVMARLGYEADTVYPYDLFPRTGHVECVVKIMRKNDRG